MGDIMQYFMTLIATSGEEVAKGLGSTIGNLSNFTSVAIAMEYYLTQTSNLTVLIFALIYESILTFGVDFALDKIATTLVATGVGIPGAVAIFMSKTYIGNLIEDEGRDVLKNFEGLAW